MGQNTNCVIFRRLSCVLTADVCVYIYFMCMYVCMYIYSPLYSTTDCTNWEISMKIGRRSFYIFFFINVTNMAVPRYF